MNRKLFVVWVDGCNILGGYWDSGFHTTKKFGELYTKPEHLCTVKYLNSNICIGVNGNNHFRLLIFTPEFEPVEERYYRNNILLDLFEVQSPLESGAFNLVLVGYTHENKSTNLLFEPSKELFSLSSVSTPPIVLHTNENFIIAWQSGTKLKIVKVNLTTKNVKMLEDLETDWTYIVGDVTSTGFYLCGYTPNEGVEVYHFDHELSVKSKKFIEVIGVSPELLVWNDQMIVALDSFISPGLTVYKNLKELINFPNLVSPKLVSVEGALYVLCSELSETKIIVEKLLDPIDFKLI